MSCLHLHKFTAPSSQHGEHVSGITMQKLEVVFKENDVSLHQRILCFVSKTYLVVTADRSVTMVKY